MTISPFRVLNRVSVCAIKVDEKQSIVTFLVPPFFSSSFFQLNSVCLNEMNKDYEIRSLGLKRLWKRNNVSYYSYSLSVQAQGGDVTF